MDISFSLITMSIMLGAGLAMDAFSVSLANGLNEPKMRLSRLFGIAAVFALFQAAMPMIGWICVHTVVQYFESFERFIPWIALALLGYIGGKMLIEGIHCKCEDCGCTKLTFGALLIQGVATSIDALSVGFTIAEHTLAEAIVSVLIIAAVTFVICSAGIFLGRKFGTALAGKAGILGGTILILIGLEIFITGVFF
ncbi:MAG: manganese efflux pump [Clostridia bacterium]|nr:manganese efflux pump [Clostridia bacterium]